MLLEKPGLGRAELLELQHEAMVRMRVFDAAPKGVQRKAVEKGEGPLLSWWKRLSADQQNNILEGRPKNAPRDVMDIEDILLGALTGQR